MIRDVLHGPVDQGFTIDVGDNPAELQKTICMIVDLFEQHLTRAIEIASKDMGRWITTNAATCRRKKKPSMTLLELAEVGSGRLSTEEFNRRVEAGEKISQDECRHPVLNEEDDHSYTCVDCRKLNVTIRGFVVGGKP